jgi:hypothetical protein
MRYSGLAVQQFYQISMYGLRLSSLSRLPVKRAQGILRGWLMAIEPSFSQFLTLPRAFSLLEPEAFGFWFRN